MNRMIQVAILLLGGWLLTVQVYGKVPTKQTLHTSSKKEQSAPPKKTFIEMEVNGVFEASPESFAVVLKEVRGTYRLPIYVGKAEAFAIELRLNKRRFERPLTHDLLDSIMHELGGQLTKIHIDDLRENTFIGTVFIVHNKKTTSIDARPSDSIALALGNRAPIYVSQEVLNQAGIREPEVNEPQEPSGTKRDENFLHDILKPKPDEHTL